MPPFQKLILHRPIYNAMIEHAQVELPNECCGLLAGTIEADRGLVSRQFALGNELASPTAYRSNPHDLLKAAKQSREAGLEFLAVYHSHPSSEPIPSQTDLRENWWGESAVHIIIGFASPIPLVRAWWLSSTSYRGCEFRFVL